MTTRDASTEAVARAAQAVFLGLGIFLVALFVQLETHESTAPKIYLLSKLAVYFEKPDKTFIGPNGHQIRAWWAAESLQNTPAESDAMRAIYHSGGIAAAGVFLVYALRRHFRNRLDKTRRGARL